MNNYFEGWYFKHQNENTMLALIPGKSDDNAFIQVITNDTAYNVEYPLSKHENKNPVKIAGNIFDTNGIELNIHSKDIELTGKLSYKKLTPIKNDIMGPFRYFPMECRHSVVSMNHSLYGKLYLNGREIDFNNGTGYIEGDRGTSFPESYTWVQCNSFDEECSVMISVAKIPFAGFKFRGCISVVWYKNKEYRLATYRGVKVLCCSENKLELKQGKYHLIVEIPKYSGHALNAPNKGKMSRTIHESPLCNARFRFHVDNQLLFDKKSDKASFEFVK